MKSFLSCSAVILISAAFLSAQTSNPAPGSGAGSAAMLTPGQIVEQMKTDLSLTDPQVKQVTPLIEEFMKTMNSLQKDQSLTREQKMEQAKTAAVAYNNKFLSVLTPEQRAKLEGLHKVMMEKAKAHEAAARAAQGSASATPAPSVTP